MSVLSDKAMVFVIAQKKLDDLRELRSGLDQRISDTQKEIEQAKVALEDAFNDVGMPKIIVPLDPGAALKLEWNSSARSYLHAEVLPIDQDAAYVSVNKASVEVSIPNLKP